MRSLLLLLVITSFVSSCKKATDTECLIPSVTFSLNDKEVIVTSTDGDVQNGFEIEYGYHADFTQGSGTIQFSSSTSTTFTVPDYGTFDVYIRKKCASGGV